MDLYARVNILGGRAVRLPKGDVAYAISLEADPIERAQSWVKKGADRLHVVDLDAAAFGEYRNRDLIAELIQTVDVPVQIAGGVRSTPEVERLLDAGAWRVVMGTVAIEDQVLIWDLCRDHPHKIVVSLDVRPDEELAVRGWTKNSGRYLEEVLIELSSAGVAGFMIHEVARDALVDPPNYAALRRALSIVDEPVIAAGGVRGLDDLNELLQLEEEGKRLGGIVVGREITEGRLTMAQAIRAIQGLPIDEPGWWDVCLPVENATESRAFYQRLGFEPVDGDPDQGWVIVSNGTLRLGLYEGRSEVSLSLRGRDVATVTDELAAQGVAIESGPEVMDDGSTSAMVYDPDGLAIYLETTPGETGPALRSGAYRALTRSE